MAAGRKSGGRSAPSFTIKTIWGTARGKELGMKNDDVYAIVFRETGKDSISDLTQDEINKVCWALFELKDRVTKSPRLNQKRTDSGGRADTKGQRQKIYALTEKLGWNNNNARINGFVKRMFKVDRLEWLTLKQCEKLIEILKDMVEREELKKQDVASGGVVDGHSKV